EGTPATLVRTSNTSPTPGAPETCSTRDTSGIHVAYRPQSDTTSQTRSGGAGRTAARRSLTAGRPSRPGLFDGGALPASKYPEPQLGRSRHVVRMVMVHLLVAAAHHHRHRGVRTHLRLPVHQQLRPEGCAERPGGLGDPPRHRGE